MGAQGDAVLLARALIFIAFCLSQPMRDVTTRMATHARLGAFFSSPRSSECCCFFCGVVVMVPYVVRLIGVPDGKLFQSIVHLINTYVAAGGVIRAAPKSDSAQ